MKLCALEKRVSRMLSRILSLELAFFFPLCFIQFSTFPSFDNIRHPEMKRKLPSYSDAIYHYYLGKVPHSFLSLIGKHQREKLNFFEIAYQVLGKVAI